MSYETFPHLDNNPRFEVDQHHAEFMALHPEPVQPTKDSSIQAERALLSFGFLSLRSLDAVADYLKPEHFVEPLHGKVFARLLAAFNRGAQDVDVIAVADELQDDVTLPELVAISHQAEGVSFGRAASLGRLVYEKAQARQLYAASQQIAELGQRRRAALGGLEDAAGAAASGARISRAMARPSGGETSSASGPQASTCRTSPRRFLISSRARRSSKASSESQASSVSTCASLSALRPSASRTSISFSRNAGCSPTQ